MKTRSIIMVLTLILVGGFASQAQDLGAGSIKLILKDSSFGGTLVPPLNAGPGEYTWTLPAQSGTIALSSTGGWLVGGQGLLPTNPGLLGSTDNANVSLIAGGLSNLRLTLRYDSTVVQTGDTVTFRFRDSADGQYVGLRSSMKNKADYTLVWPDSMPAGNDVRLQVDSIIGKNVYLRWSNPLTTGSIGFRKSGAATPTQGAGVNDYTNVEGMYFSLDPNAIYSFEAYLTVAGGVNDGALLRFGQPYATGAKGAYTAVGGVTVSYYIMTLTAANPVVNGDPNGMAANIDTPELASGETFILKGYIETDNSVAPGTLLQIVMRANQAAVVSVTAKSSVQLITE